MLTVVAALVLAAIVAGGLLARGGDDPYAAYCDAVEDHQQAIGLALGDGAETTGFLRALPDLRAVAAEAPSDIHDEWQVVIDRIAALEDALDDAGVDPASYDPASPSKDLSEEQRVTIERTADRLLAPETFAAFAGVDQQVRDVCQTRLSL
ncbi:hypothetical protein ACFQ0K_18160 [Nocardioides caeni]|uniref:Uncharacterized protein n=1 Tax=Nocardioides caeni TaxID=574700 RepID=A0A4S8NB25_9ACTN|nr:hypothetical protein [Nocardioides caeni]THV13315.1 hypothetical protein E9934_10125 [Nocardioides caeni]